MSDDAQTRILRSIDGGVSWEISDVLNGGFAVQAGLSLDALLLRRTGSIDESGAEFVWWPSGEPVDRPGLGGSFGPYVLTAGDPSWWKGGTLVDGHRNPLLRLGDEITSGSAAGFSFVPSPDREVIALNWNAGEQPASDPLGPWRISLYEDWRSTYRAVDSFDFHAAFAPIAWLSESELLVRGLFTPEMLGDTAAPRPTARSAYLPAILDLEERELVPLDFPTQAYGFGEQTLLVAAQAGAFAEMDAGEGSCLNLRTEPSLDGGALRCIAHATLLERLSPLDGEWVNVRTSDGVTGWVSGEFVRGGRGGPEGTATPKATATADASGTATPE